MRKHRILYIGESKTHEEYLKGRIPSHWFYGAVEMEKDGNDVIWCQEQRGKFHDLSLIGKFGHDIIFIPNLNLQTHMVLLTLASLGLYRKPIYGYLHRMPAVRKGWKKYLYKFLLKGLRHVFFLSEKSMQSTVESGLLSQDKCSVPGWGPDMKFYAEIPLLDEGYFVSTGKENRDFDVMIEAFRRTGCLLKIYTVADNYTSHYSYILEKCREIPNIEVFIIDNSASNYPLLVKEMANAKGLVCSLRKDKLNYCVGLSTVADAEALGKPLIITPNTYHVDRVKNGRTFLADSVDDWVKAIETVNKGIEGIQAPSDYNIDRTYSNMKSKMNL